MGRAKRRNTGVGCMKVLKDIKYSKDMKKRKKAWNVKAYGVSGRQEGEGS